MSNRSLLEFNHDLCPKEEDLLTWAAKLKTYITSGDSKELPQGVTFIAMRHHSERLHVSIDTLDDEHRSVKG